MKWHATTARYSFKLINFLSLLLLSKVRLESDVGASLAANSGVSMIAVGVSSSVEIEACSGGRIEGGLTVVLF